MGSGADSLTLDGTGFGGFGELEFDLGADTDADTISFGLDSSYAGITISNFGESDVLFIGKGGYGYGYSFLNEYSNAFDLETFRWNANVIWAQNTPGDASDQSLMTLDDSSFMPDDYGFSETAADDGSNILESTEVITSLADETTWIGADPASAPASASDDPPEPTLFIAP